MVEVWDVTVPELTGDEPRRAYIYLPESYLHEPDRRYPVLYMFPCTIDTFLHIDYTGYESEIQLLFRSIVNPGFLRMCLLVFPIEHMTPAVRETVKEILGGENTNLMQI